MGSAKTFAPQPNSAIVRTHNKAFPKKEVASTPIGNSIFKQRLWMIIEVHFKTLLCYIASHLADFFTSNPSRLLDRIENLKNWAI